MKTKQTKLTAPAAYQMPNSKDLEEVVLGAILLDKDAFETIQDTITSGTFYNSANAIVFQSIQGLYQSGFPIDLVTVTEALRKSKQLEKVGGAHYLVQLTNRVASSANLEYHARILKQAELKRRAIHLGDGYIKKGQDPGKDALELIEEIQKDAMTLGNMLYQGQAYHISKFIPDLIKETDLKRQRKDELVGIPSGLTGVDDLIGGWQAPDLVIIAARPGMGKTAFVMKVTKTAVQDEKKGVAIFSLEMSAAQLIHRLISLEAKIPGALLRDPKKMSPQIHQNYLNSIERMAEVPLFIDDTPGINIFQLRAKARRLVKEDGVELIIVDYIQLMNGSGNERTREQEVSKISRSLKELAKELNVPIIALSQLSRSVEARGGDKRPQLQDLRESGGLEQDADIVGFLYRAEYYQILEDEEGNSTANTAELIIAKHRQGALDTIGLRFWKTRAEFDNYEEVPF
jgi:replicative DNA helicase